jgi:hypothetical protein
MFVLTVVFLAGATAHAQTFGNRTIPATEVPQVKAPLTQVTVELLTGDEGAGLRAHRWRDIFEKLDVTFVIRRSFFNEKPEIKERKISDSIRQVQIIGRLEPTGRLVFTDRTFTENDVGRLTTWLKDLKTYGALGTPDGQPAWGLTKQQFGRLYEALARPLAVDPKGRDIALALTLFELPADYPLKLSTDAKKKIEAAGTRLEVQQSYVGLSQGTALAAMLRERGLGFQPRRLPDGRIELNVVDLAETNDVWPVGWVSEKGNQKIAPGLFEFHRIELNDIELSAVLDTVRDLASIPVLVDLHGLKAKEIDPAKVRVNFPLKKTTWGIALGPLTFKAHARYELLVDEAGKAFLWIVHLETPRHEELQSAANPAK